MNGLFLDFTLSSFFSAALFSDGKCLYALCSHSNVKHLSGEIPLLVGNVLLYAGKGFEEIDFVCVSRGPGSFTSLRSIISYVKGLNAASGIPVYSFSSFEYIAFSFFSMFEDEKVSLLLFTGSKSLFYYSSFSRNSKGLPKADGVINIVRLEDISINKTKVISSEREKGFLDINTFIREGAIAMGRLFFALDVKPKPENIESLSPDYVFV